VKDMQNITNNETTETNNECQYIVYAKKVTITTSCTVAQQCYNGDVNILWENWKFDLL